MESEVSNLRATRTLDPHQSDRVVQSDLSYRHYMMNMVRLQHKSAFVSPPSSDYSQPATASQSGSKWPKGPRPKKKAPKLVQYNGPCKSQPPLAPPHHTSPLLVSAPWPRVWFLLCWVVWSLEPIQTFTDVSLKSAELHTFQLFFITSLGKNRQMRKIKPFDNKLSTSGHYGSLVLGDF